MINSYFKLAIKVLKRNPFFTGVNLFGISFTLTVLMLLVAYLQNQLGSESPMGNSNGLVYFYQLEQQYIEKDTSWVVDSTQVDGEWVKDSTMQTSENNNMTSISGFGYDFLKQYFSLERMTTASKITILDRWSNYDIYHNEVKINTQAKHVDEHYFEIFDFKFLEGRPFKGVDIEQIALNLIITEDFANRYFGSMKDLIGKKVYLDNKDFEVIGVVKKARINNDYVAADIFLPLSYINQEKNRYGHFGSFAAVLLSSQNNTTATLAEVKQITQNIPFLPPSEHNGQLFNYMKIHAMTPFQLNASNFFFSRDPQESAQKFIIAIVMLIGLFCLVPLLNLINLNISRILDRAAEIGVRKAFGAQTSNILYQIIFENIILTLIGAIIALMLTYTTMHLINTNHILDQLRLTFNLEVFLISFLVAIVFGVLSGYLPARKIARSNIVESLKH
jgi:putative ABC transport system permease protein